MSDLGRCGEQVAAEFLESNGLRVLDRNVRAGRGEIDLVASDGACLVFVEVKTRTGASMRELTGLESVNARKRSALRRACGLLRARFRPPPESYRLDIVVVEFPDRCSPRTEARPPRVRWYPAVLDLDAGSG